MADVSKMYRAIELAPSDKDLHQFVWRTDPGKPLTDCRTSRVTFGVSASSFIANMCIKKNAVDLALEYPQAAKVLEDSYMDDCLTGADTNWGAIELQKQLQELFTMGGFLLCKWRSSEPEILNDLPNDLKDPHSMLISLDADAYTKTLDLTWNATYDHFRLTVTSLPPPDNLTISSFMVSLMHPNMLMLP